VDEHLDEARRAASLLHAQAQAEELFELIVASGLIRPGVTESQLSDEIRDLAAQRFGVSKHWHKRVVRTGRNTLAPYAENPPDLVVSSDDICFLDFGPVFDDWEADFGRTYVLGDDPLRLALRDALAPSFATGVAWFQAHPEATGEQLYAYMHEVAERQGYLFGGSIAGHLLGEFPHERISTERRYNMIAPGNDRPMRAKDSAGRRAHWILEVHLVDPTRSFGGFYEQLLTL
jgi:Xaa-Pro aminopeptidase